MSVTYQEYIQYPIDHTYNECFLFFSLQAKKPTGSDRVHNSESLDYGSYDTGDDHNLVFYDKPVPGAGKLTRNDPLKSLN